jgi:GNAT superfamily N-acetyltransferase
MFPDGSVAQLVERSTENRKVTGSTPVRATTAILAASTRGWPFYVKPDAVGRVRSSPGRVGTVVTMTSPLFQLRPAEASDASWMAELRAVVMRDDLVRLGIWDPIRVRRRFLDAFRPAHTSVIGVDGEWVGLIAVREQSAEKWIEHFYLDATYQGAGIGSGVLAEVMLRHEDSRPFRLNVLRGSAARRLYDRHGFVFDSSDGVDDYLIRHPQE